MFIKFIIKLDKVKQTKLHVYHKNREEIFKNGS